MAFQGEGSAAAACVANRLAVGSKHCWEADPSWRTDPAAGCYMLECSSYASLACNPVLQRLV